MRDRILENIPLRDVKVDDVFWNRYTRLVPEVILPFMWDLINDQVEGAEKSYCIQNFRIAAGQQKGIHQGMVFQDTDVAKWLEAVAYSLMSDKDEELERCADQAIDLIAQAQCEDGYLNTYYSITGEKRWSDLFEGHELYTAGHMIEAAVAYYEATGKRKFLDVVCRFADYIGEVFGEGKDQIPGYPGHPEVELALVRLYRVTGDRKYLELARYFVEARGKEPCYFMQEEHEVTKKYIFPEFKDFRPNYVQAHLPVRLQKTAEGHAVRAVYLYSGIADLAGEYKDESLQTVCETLWNNIVNRRMYITGGIGSAAYGERFTTDYDLPNNTGYSESCASIGLAMLSNRMLHNTGDGKYADVVEKALYNTVLAGIALDGKHFFYVNPLEVVPDIAEKNPTMAHVKTVRQQWFGVACCPPNIARTLASLGNYIYCVGEDIIFSNLFISSEIHACGIRLQTKANYPVSGQISYRILADQPVQMTLAIRKPGYVKDVKVCINDSIVTDYTIEKGYIYLKRMWENGDSIKVSLDVPFRFMRSDPHVYENIGRVCLMKGPWVYCIEEADNGKYLSSVIIDTSSPAQEVYDESLLGGTLCARLKGKRISYDSVGEELYTEEPPEYENCSITAVPYCSWNNRGRGEMLVWMKADD